MEVRTKGIGHRVLNTIRRIDDNAGRVIVVGSNTACPPDCTVTLVDALANRRIAVHPIGRSIGNCFVNPRLAHVPNTDIVTPRVGIFDHRFERSQFVG